MGFNFRKSFKLGPARINLSKSGVGYSVGAGGVRFTKSAKKKKRSDSGGCFGTLFKWMLIFGAFLLVLYFVGNYWPWLLGAATLVAAVIIGVKIYKAKKEQAGEDQDGNE